MTYSQYESKLRNRIIEKDLKAELRRKIVEIFSIHEITEKGESLCEIFVTIDERNASYAMILELHQNWLRAAMKTAIEVTTDIYKSKLIAA